jgi:hypothetical protein
MTTEDGATYGGRIAMKGTGIRLRLSVVTDEAKAQARCRSVLATGFGAIYELYQRRVFLWCLHIARNVEDAEDLTQEMLFFFELTGWSIGTSKSQLHKARRRLRKLLECERGKAIRASRSRSVRAGKNPGWGRQP